MLFLLLSTVSAMDTGECLPLYCNANTTQDYCIDANSTYITLYTCTPGFYCNTTILNDDNAITSQVDCVPLNRSNQCQGSGDLSEGRQCCTNTDCKSGSCYNLICTGISPCVVDEDCVGNQYCASGSCVASLSDGSACSSDNQCNVGSGCNAGLCTPLFSLDSGSNTTAAKFCSTNFMFDGACDYVSVYVNRTFQTNPFVCFTPRDMCNYTTGYAQINITFEPCTCAGSNNPTVGYCSKYMLNDYNYSVNLYANIAYNSSNCGGESKNTVDVERLLECGSISKSQYYWFIQNQQRALYWNIYQAGILDECAVALDLYDPNWSDARLIFYMSVFFLVIVIYL
jgi:hypothetical protein